MDADSRAYIELRFDGHSCDAVLVLFRDRGILPIEVDTREFCFESTGEAPYGWDEVKEQLIGIIEEL